MAIPLVSKVFFLFQQATTSLPGCVDLTETVGGIKDALSTPLYTQYLVPMLAKSKQKWVEIFISINSYFSHACLFDLCIIRLLQLSWENASSLTRLQDL